MHGHCVYLALNIIETHTLLLDGIIMLANSKIVGHYN